jgi:hypothetical protein
MRSAASRGTMRRPGVISLLRVLALVLVNPVGLWLTWSSNSSPSTKRLVTLVSVLWYLAAAALALSLTHLR